jgi:hypothetical protein
MSGAVSPHPCHLRTNLDQLQCRRVELIVREAKQHTCVGILRLLLVGETADVSGVSRTRNRPRRTQSRCGWRLQLGDGGVTELPMLVGDHCCSDRERGLFMRKMLPAASILPYSLIPARAQSVTELAKNGSLPPRAAIKPESAMDLRKQRTGLRGFHSHPSNQRANSVSSPG